MYALAINGSPRRGGNTEILLNSMLESFKKENWDTDCISVGGLPMQGCQACMQCFTTKDRKCCNNEDTFNAIAAECFKADVLLLGSPVYFTGMTAELKAFTDRLGIVAIANDRLLAGKIGAAVVAVRRGGATHVFDALNHVFQISRMIVPGSTYWNFAFGQNPGEVLEDQEGMTNMRDLAQTILWLSGAIASYDRPFPVQL